MPRRLQDKVLNHHTVRSCETICNYFESHLPSKSKLWRVNGCSRRERKTSGISVVIFSVNGPSVRGEADVTGALGSTGQDAGVRRRRRPGSSHKLQKRQHLSHANKCASYLIRPAPFPNLVLTQPISSVLFSVDGRKEFRLGSSPIHHSRHSQ